jgi:hypothetical protein
VLQKRDEIYSERHLFPISNDNTLKLEGYFPFDIYLSIQPYDYAYVGAGVNVSGLYLSVV